jgi:hypothetical protein
MEATVSKKNGIALLVATALCVALTAGMYLSVAKFNQAEVNVSWVPPGGAAVIPVSIQSGTIDGSLDVAGLLDVENGVELTGNLTQTSGSILAANLVVSGTSDLRGIVSSDGGNILRLNENTVVTGTLAVSGDADLNGALDVAGVVSCAGNDFRLNDNALITGTVTASGVVDFNSTLAVAGVATFESVASVGTFLRYTVGVTQVVVNTQPITPTATYMQIAAVPGVNVFTDNLLRAGALTGQLWILQNIGVPTITITDANTCDLNATYAMGISDTLTLVFDGTSWVEVGRSNN